MPKSKKSKKNQKRAARKPAETNSEEENVEQNEPTGTKDDDGDVNMSDLDPDFHNLSDDEAPWQRQRRHKKPRSDDWAADIIQNFVKKRYDEIKTELQSETPDFPTLEGWFQEVNQKIRKGNKEHGVSVESNLIPVNKYRNEFDTWSAYINSNLVEDNPERGWKAYDGLRNAFFLFNREHGLPIDWNIPPDVTKQLFGDRPENMETPHETNDTDSAVDFSDESESEESSDEVDGIDALESRMRKEYSALSRGKVLYWWPVGTGTQIFVRYGSKRTPIYRVRAGSSEPYDQKMTEMVLSKTRGNSKSTLPLNGINQEVWKYSRNEVLDIIGVGWKVEDDDEANLNALALIRPERYATYPHTRVLVKWKDGHITLERRAFVRRIANGNNFNGDRMIYMKAKELEDAYWGYDVEEYWDQDSDSGDNMSSDEYRSHYRRTSSPGKHFTNSRRGVRFTESEQESDADSETSQSSLDRAQTTRKSKRHSSARKSKSSKDADMDAKIRLLMEELKRLQVKQQRSHGNQAFTQSRRRKSRGW